MQDRKQAFDRISHQLAIIRHDIEQHQAIQDYSLNTHAENFFRDVFNFAYGCHLENANFQSANTPCLDLLDKDKKLAYQITSTISKEKIINTLQALKKQEYQGYEIKLYYLLGKPNLKEISKQEILADFAINIDDHLFDCNDLIKDINDLENDKLIALQLKCFKEIDQAPSDTVKVDIFHLPEPTTALVGRKTELAQLTEAFTNPNKRLAIIVAAGGIGKSALTDEWLKEIETQNYHGKTRVFGWSFYSQGSHNTFTSSQPFFSAVFEFLNEHLPKNEPIEIPKDEIEKARVLAKYLQQQPCLLILDGLEPLQYAQNLAAMNGELLDSSLKEFIACIRRTAGKSFVLLSSRQPLVELKKWQAEHYLSLDLKTLPHEDGAELLQALGVKGNEIERQAISKDLNGHALSLVLFGHLLNEHHQGDPRYAKELPPLTSAHGDSDAEKDSRHALRVLDYYDSLQDEASRCFLQLLGLFDRPMGREEKAVLIANANHAEPLRALTEKEWTTIEELLEKNGLLLGKKGTFRRLEWDTHPIIRSYFGDKFKKNHPERFKQAHLVLFDFFQKQLKKEFPDTLEEILPVYRAVAHSCLAEEYNQAYNVYSSDTIRYSIQKFNPYSLNLTVISAFFPGGWTKIIPAEKLEEPRELHKPIRFAYDSIAKSCQLFLMRTASRFLTSAGRLLDAIRLTVNEMELSIEYGKFHSLHISTHNLAELNLLLGNLSEAKIFAEEAVSYSEKFTYGYEHLTSKAYLANILHCCGDLYAAHKLFQQQLEYLDSFFIVPSLNILRGCQYCNLLLDFFADNAAIQSLVAKAQLSLFCCSFENHLIDEPFYRLLLARVAFALTEFSKAENYFEQAIPKYEDICYSPIFYLYRADFYLTQNQLDQAQDDLNSAWEIIERCGLKLYQVDYLLIHGRYCLAIKDHDTALNHYEEAKHLIKETGYHLRDAELDLFAAKLRQQCSEEYRHANPGLYCKTAEDYLQKAKNRIAEIGQWGLMRVIERDFPEGVSP